MKKSITLVNQTTGPLFIDIANSLVQHDFNVTLLAGRIESTYAELDQAIVHKSFVPYNRKTAVQRLSTWFLFTWIAFFKLLFGSSKKPLLLVSNPPFVPMLGLLIKKIRRRPYYLLIYDIYPEAIVNFGILSKNSIFVKIWNKLNSSLYKNAEIVFTISEFMEKTIKADYEESDNLSVIPNWVDNSFIKPLEKKENWFAKEHDQLEKVTVMYSGNLGVTHDLESIVESARELQDRQKINFMIIGDGAKKVRIQEMITEYKLDNIQMLPFQDAKNIPFSMTTADISIVTLAKGAEGLSVPSKTYYMMAAGSVVIAIASKDSELASIIERYEIGATFEPGDHNGISEFIAELAQNEEKMSRLKENSNKASMQFTPRNADIYSRQILKTTNEFVGV